MAVDSSTSGLQDASEGLCPVHQEYFDSMPTGVELEEDQPIVAATQKEPWDPDEIRIHTRSYSLRQVVDMIEEGDIDLAPDFQRRSVWKPVQRNALIESILLGIPLPSFYFNEERDGRIQVVDGVQRLTTIFGFVRRESFALGAVVYLKGLEGKRFAELDGVFRRRANNTQLVVHVIDPQTPYKVKFDIFKRINTGGTPLAAQEIRHCVSLNRSRHFLGKLVASEAFVKATGRALQDHVRMADREVALRYCAFRITSVDEYAQYESLDEFLGAVTRRIDLDLSDADLDKLARDFEQAMTNAWIAFGEHAFRKWPLGGTERLNPINRALVESWGNVLTDYTAVLITERKKLLVERARELMSSDSQFIQAIGSSTGDVEKVRTRFKKVRKVAKEVLG